MAQNYWKVGNGDCLKIHRKKGKRREYCKVLVES
jgi:hypothetical protein